MPNPGLIRTNDDWIAALKTHDRDALESLRAYLCNRLEAVLVGSAGQSDVEDFVQDALERILSSIDRFRGDSRFTTWASAIAVRVAFSELRRKRWGSLSLDALVNEGVQWESESTSSVADAARTELLTAMREAIEESLTERQRAVIIAELRQMPSATLSAELGMSRGALYKMHHDARKKLRIYLEQKGFTEEDCRAVLEGVVST